MILRQLVNNIIIESDGDNMKKILNVDGMSCDHCIKRITNAVNEVEGAKCLNISLEDKAVEVEVSDENVLGQVKEAIEDVGYDVIENE